MCTSNSLPAIPFLETFSSGDCVQCTLKSGPPKPLPTSRHFRQRKQVAIFCTYPPTFAFSAKEGKLPASRSWVLGGSWWKAVQRQIMVDCVWCFDSVFGTTYTHSWDVVIAILLRHYHCLWDGRDDGFGATFCVLCATHQAVVSLTVSTLLLSGLLQPLALWFYVIWK